MTNTTSDSTQQSRIGQFVDAATLIALLFITLFVTTFVFAQESEEAPSTGEPVAISQLNISPAEKQQFELMKSKDMVDDATVAQLTTDNAPSNDKYKIEWLPLIGITALAAAYLAFVYLMSFREYREVITARFGPGTES